MPPDEQTRHTATARAFSTALLFVVALAIVALAISVTSAPAEGRFPINNFTNVDDTATVTPGGRNVAVSGWVKCTESHTAHIRVTATQGSTEASGRTHVRCLGQSTVQTWMVHVTAHGPETFDAEDTVAVDAWTITSLRGLQTDGPHTWSNDVTLTHGEHPRGNSHP